MSLPGPNADVLGRLLTIPSLLDALPDARSTALFLARVLEDIPGIRWIQLCLDQVIYPERRRGPCDRCPLVSPGLTAGARTGSCSLEGVTDVLPVATNSLAFGAILVSANEGSEFAIYKPHVINIANILATILENRRLIDELRIKNKKLQDAQEVLEKRVDERTRDLAQSEERYRDLYDNAPAMFVSVDAETARIVQCNATLARNLGYSKKEIIGRPIFDVYHEDCMEKVHDAFQTFIATGKVDRDDLILKRRDGSKIWVSLNVASVRDETGNILYSRSVWRDISEQKKAENLHQTLFDQSPNAILVLDPETTRPAMFNDQFCELLGYTRAETANLSIADYALEETPEAISRKTEAILQNGTDQFETRFRTKDNKEKNVVVSIRVLEQSGKKLFHNVIRDITDQKKSEEALRFSEKESTRRLHVSNTLASLSRFLISQTGSIEAVADQVLGHARRLSRSEHGFVSEIDPETKENMVRSSAQRVRHAGRVDGESHKGGFSSNSEGIQEDLWGHALNTRMPFFTNTPSRHPASKKRAYEKTYDGSVSLRNFLSVPVMFSGLLVGQIVLANSSRGYTHDDLETVERIADLYAIAVVRNREAIAMRNIEADTNATKERLEALVSSVPVILYTADPRKDFASVFVSHDVKDRLGYEVQECLDDSNFWHSRIHPHDKKRVDQELQALSLNRPIVTEYRFRHCDGRYRWLRDEVKLIYSAVNDAELAIGQKIDITERKLAEADLVLKTAALERSNEELRQFAYVASHDLQEPLTVIEGYLKILARMHLGKLGTQTDQFIDFTLKNIERMKSLIKDLLAFSYLESRAEPFRPADLNEIVQEVLKEIGSAFDESKATLSVADLPTLPVDREQITKLFQNIIENALKFRKPAVAPDIRIEAAKEAGFWRFSVQDNGIGIDSAFSKNVFTIFQRLHSRDVFPGTGVGLAICKRIVQRHGGSIWVESVVGEGSTFQFTLPEEQIDEIG